MESVPQPKFRVLEASHPSRVLIVGGGVIGLSIGARLSEHGFRCEIRTECLAQYTTSAVAPALFLPFMVHTAEQVRGLGARSRDWFQSLTRERCGVRELRGRVLLDHEELAGLAFHGLVWDEWQLPAKQLPEGYRLGVQFTTFCIRMDDYLPWLTARFRDNGGEIVEQRVDSLEALLAETDIVVNCTGLGARALVPDPALEPVWGQVVVVENPGLEEFLVAERAPHGDFAGEVTYFIPRGEDCVLGGTAIPGFEASAPDARVTEGILERCARMEPRLRAAKVLSERAAARAVRRPALRLKAEATQPRLIHAYGFGGGGVSLSPAVAEEVEAMVRYVM